MKRSIVSLTEIADLRTLSYALWRAARSKRDRPEVKKFVANWADELTRLSHDTLNETLALGRFNFFRIYDPKPREISAPSFRERVLHHALIYHIGPILDRAAVFDSYACRKNKGNVRAVKRAQQHLRRFPWYVKIDISHFFDSIDHEILKSLLSRKLKSKGVLTLCGRIIDSYHTQPGNGLPIGALTSQFFANYYLNSLDRLLLEGFKVSGMVRYMDDVVWWLQDKDTAKATLDKVRTFLFQQLALEIKENPRIQRSRCGLPLCGYRILPGTIRLSRRRQRLYKDACKQWQTVFQQGWIGPQHLQLCYDAARSITAHADAVAFRRSIHAKTFHFSEEV